VRDAKLDGVYLRGERNFSCGTECYRAYDVDVDSGTIFITITGQASAVSKNILGRYKLGPTDTKWTKIQDGIPSE